MLAVATDCIAVSLESVVGLDHEDDDDDVVVILNPENFPFFPRIACWFVWT